MRYDSVRFAQADRSADRRPRFVVNIEFETGSLYFTSHSGISGVPGTVFEGVVEDISAVSQRIVPDEGRSEIGSMSFALVDRNSAITTEFRSKLNSSKGLRGKTVRLYRGFEGFTWSEFSLFQTQIIRDAEYDLGGYSIECSDITREQRKDVFDPKATTLRLSCTDTDTTIAVYDTAAFLAVEHGVSWSDAPSITCGYIKIQDEIIRWTGKTPDSFTGCTRGALNTRAKPHAVDAATAADQRTKVEEVVYLELPAAKLAYAILTGVLHGQTGTLPSNWHLGISTSMVKLSDFTGVGPDLWDTSNDLLGLILRFTQEKGQDGKSFLEKQVYQPMGCFSPIYADGRIGLRRMAALTSDAASVVTLTEREVVSHSALTHDMSGMINQFQVDWSYDGKEPRRRSKFIDRKSTLVHGTAPVKKIEWRGLYGSRHTDTVIWQRLFALRDRYSAPPKRLQVQLLASLSGLEVGDVARVKVKNLRDYTGSGSTIDSAFEVQRLSINHQTGDLDADLFGSTSRPATTPPSDITSFPLPDAFYTSQGTALSSVSGITIASNVLTVAPGTAIGGNADLTNAGAIFYHDGDLTIANGVTLKIASNWQLRVRGALTINGTIDGNYGGLAGVADDGAVSPYLSGNPGFIGNSRGRDGIRVTEMGGNPQMESQPVPTTQGRFDAFPFLSLSVSGNTLQGLPTDLRGTGGGPGGKVIEGSTFRAAGGTGGAGGAGLCIIARRVDFGASGQITLRGADTASPSPYLSQGKNFYPGTGGAGGPGALLILLDAGPTVSVPDLTSKFYGVTGSVAAPFYSAEFPILFLPSRAHQRRNRSEQPYAGYEGPEIVSALDLSNAAHRIQYIPAESLPTDDVDDPPPPPQGLSATAGPGYIQIRVTPADIPDVVTEIYTSASTLANAEIVDTIRGSVLNHQLVQQERRFYWARTKLEIDDNTTVYSAWFPGTVSLVEATAQAVANADVPEEVDFLETFEGQNVADRYDSVSGNGIVTYPTGQGSYGGRVLQVSGGQRWFVLKRNVPFDPGGFYRVTVRARLTVAPTNALNDRLFAGVAAVAADGVTLLNVNGLNSQANQHYIGASGLDLGSVPLGTWVSSIGYFSGVSTTPVGYAPSEDQPSTLFTGAAYFRPLIIANYDQGDGTTQVDYLRVEKWTGTRWVDIAGDAKADDRATMTSTGNLITNGTGEFGDNRNFTGLGLFTPPALTYVATGGVDTGGAYFATPAMASTNITPDQSIPVVADLHEYEFRLSLKSPDASNIVFAGVACLDEDGNNITHARAHVSRVAELNASVSAGATTLDVLAHADDWSLVSGFKALCFNVNGYALNPSYWTRLSNFLSVGLSSITKTDLGGGVWRYTLPAGVTVPNAYAAGTQIALNVEGGTFLYPLWNGEALTSSWVERSARFRDVNQVSETTDQLSYLLAGERYYTLRRGTVRVAPVIIHNYGSTTARTTHLDRWTMLSFGDQHRKALSPNLDPYYSSFAAPDHDFIYAEDTLWRTGVPSAWTLSKTGGVIGGRALVDVAGQILTSGGNPVVYLETPDKKDYPNRFPIRRVRVIKGRSVTAYCRWRRLNTWTTSPGGDSVFLDLSIVTYSDDRSVSTVHRKLSSPGGLTSINSRTVNVWQEESVTWTLGATVNDYYLVGRIEFFSSGATLMAAGQIEIDYFDIR